LNGSSDKESGYGAACSLPATKGSSCEASIRPA
jgi:hypothetical protein